MIWKDPRINDVKPKDRIKWWNVVPGDQVRVLGDKEGSIREVFRINKLSNRVYLKRQVRRFCIAFDIILVFTSRLSLHRERRMPKN